MSNHVEPGYVFWGFTIPKNMIEIIQDYVNYGHSPGEFLTAVICNDLHTAIIHADDHSILNLRAYIGYFYNETPTECWGSYENMKAWTNKRGKHAQRKGSCRNTLSQPSAMEGIRRNQEYIDSQRIRF